jgi:hypothetical protein
VGIINRIEEEDIEEQIDEKNGKQQIGYPTTLLLQSV